jgi:uncharacterized protein YaaR (DUF327 family)
MNEIIKFTDYTEINENVIIPVVDAVISDSGILNTKTATGLPLKGSVELNTIPVFDIETGKKVMAVSRTVGQDSKAQKTKKVVSGIKGNDGKYYPGGLDKNGTLVGVNFDENNYLLTLGATESRTRIPIDPESQSKLDTKYQDIEFWNKDVDYIKCVPNISTGWVNVKIDMEVIKRVRRYSAGLVEKEKASDNSHLTFVSKLKSLDRISNRTIKIDNITRQKIQKQMSAIILLHYINEIKTFFTPSAAGLLFESFIGGLIPYAKVTEDNGKADITVPTDDGKIEYQVKLYSTAAQYIDIAVNRYDDDSIHPNREVPLDYYLICIKKSDEVIIYVLNNDPTSPGYYSKFRTSGKNSKSKTFSVNELNNSKLDFRTGTKFILSLTNLEERIKNLGDSLKGCLDELYRLLSQFQYNVETIITGVDQDGKKVSETDFSKHSTDATNNVKSMSEKLDELIKEVNINR